MLPLSGCLRAPTSSAHPPVLLLDADGSLFPSEEPAFVASSAVTNRFLASLGVLASYTPEHLLATTTGKNFRTTAVDLAVAHGVPVHRDVRRGGGSSTPATGRPLLTATALDDWVAEEKRVVSDHLGQVLRPDPDVVEPLRRLAERYLLSAVSSSALSRLDRCFRAAGIADLIPPDRRFSAEDSLPRPTSKPDPAVYLYAAEQLGVPVEEALAVEDSLPGARSAIAAGIATVGNLTFVGAGERPVRRAELLDAGVVAVIEDWEELAAALLDGAASSSHSTGNGAD
jgi:beta-phosphoglucomutase-like phosphatase (HAD superfamily)